MASGPNILFSDGARTILAEPWECGGCHTMHYFFVLTVEGHRCVDCAAKLEREAVQP